MNVYLYLNMALTSELKKQIKECKHQKNIIRLKWKVFDLENKKLRE